MDIELYARKKSLEFIQCPRSTKVDGSERRTGFELEFCNLSVTQCAQLLKQQLGGELSVRNTFSASVADSELGTLKVTLDSRIMQILATNLEERSSVEKIDVNLRQWLKRMMQWTDDVTRTLVPIEVTTPPLVYSDFSLVDKLRDTLRKAGAHGTTRSFINAFGLHINPELPSLEVQCVLQYLQAFLVLYPWLKRQLKIDLSRRLLSYINPFPTSYLRLVLNKDYSPDLESFADDYLQYNPTRNRALDLLPLLSHTLPSLESRLRKKERDLLKPRPTLHYRLPNCAVDQLGWSVAKEWNHWVEVEKLAAVPEKLAVCLEACQELLNLYMFPHEETWIQTVLDILDLE